MPKLYRGDVIYVLAPAGPKEFKERPVIVLQNCKSDDGMITVYCTSQNNGDDENNIFVKVDSEEGIAMGLTKDTWIRPAKIINLPGLAFVRKIGRCGLMREIQQILEKVKTK